MRYVATTKYSTRLSRLWQIMSLGAKPRGPMRANVQQWIDTIGCSVEKRGCEVLSDLKSRGDMAVTLSATQSTRRNSLGYRAKCLYRFQNARSSAYRGPASCMVTESLQAPPQKKEWAIREACEFDDGTAITGSGSRNPGARAVARDLVLQLRLPHASLNHPCAPSCLVPVNLLLQQPKAFLSTRSRLYSGVAGDHCKRHSGFAAAAHTLVASPDQALISRKKPSYRLRQRRSTHHFHLDIFLLDSIVVARQLG